MKIRDIRYNRGMRLGCSLLWVLAALLLAGCPAGGGRANQRSDAPTSDVYDEYANLLQTETGLNDEVKRLQNLVATPAASAGQVSEPPYAISFETGPTGVDIVLTGAGTEDTWKLSAWRSTGGRHLPITIMRDEPGSGGRSFEAAIGQELTLSLQLRWVEGGGVQVQRGLLLGGLELVYRFSEGECDWVLSGPWRPYRLVPQPAGPWGIAPAHDGQWYGGIYPGASWLPAGAVFNRDGGWLVGMADEHARKLDRQYAVEWRVSKDYQAGELLRLRTGLYDSTSGSYYPGSLASGLEQRDAIVLVPLAFTLEGQDQSSTEVQATQVVEALGRYVRQTHYTPQAPPHPIAGNAVRLSDWLAGGAAEDDARELDRLAASANVHYALITAQELDAGILTGSLSSTLAALGILPIIDTTCPATAHPSSSLRDPQQAASWLRGMTGKSAVSEDAQAPANWCWDLPQPFVAGVGDALPSQRAGAPPAPMFPTGEAPHQAVLSLHAAEVVRTAYPNSLLLIKNYPQLGLPVFGDGYLAPSARANSQVGGSGGTNTSLEQVQPWAARMANRLACEVFGASLLATSPDGTLAGLVLAADGHQAGLYLERSLAQYAGFDALCQHTEALAAWGQEVQFVYTRPEVCDYTLDGERPAAFQEVIALVPAQHDSSATLWVVFLGVGGSVAVDYRNNLFITWKSAGAEQAWSTRLPVGFWKVDHPTPLDIKSGDAVLVRKDTLVPNAQPGMGAEL